MKKRSVTLLEMMIVITLIGLIASVIGYNMKGSLDRGKAFKTEESQKQIKDILLLESTKNSKSVEEVSKDPKYYLEHSGLPKNVDKLLEDGWGDKFVIEVSKDKKDLLVLSKNLDKYNKQHNKPSNRSSDEEEYY